MFFLLSKDVLEWLPIGQQRPLCKILTFPLFSFAENWPIMNRAHMQYVYKYIPAYHFHLLHYLGFDVSSEQGRLSPLWRVWENRPRRMCKTWGRCRTLELMFYFRLTAAPTQRNVNVGNAALG